MDFALAAGTVRWNEISQAQAKALFPPGKGKDLLTPDCSICHSFQSRMASVRRDADGWKDRVEYMRSAMHFSLYHLTDEQANEIAFTYINSLFGPDSVAAEIACRYASIQGHGPAVHERRDEYRLRRVRHARAEPHAVRAPLRTKTVMSGSRTLASRTKSRA